MSSKDFRPRGRMIPTGLLRAFALIIAAALYTSPEARLYAQPNGSGEVGNEAKREKIRELLTLMKTTATMEQTLATMMTSFSQMNPSVPEWRWQALFEDVDYNELIEIIVDIYDRHFTIEDVEGLLAFYRSDLGQKLIANQPVIVEESMQAGMEWGTSLYLRMQEKLLGEGEGEGAEEYEVMEFEMESDPEEDTER